MEKQRNSPWNWNEGSYLVVTGIWYTVVGWLDAGDEAVAEEN